MTPKIVKLFVLVTAISATAPQFSSLAENLEENSTAVPAGGPDKYRVKDWTDADDDRSWRNPDEIVVADYEIAFSHQKYGPTKNESIFFMSYFNDGWVLMFQLFHIKTKVYEKWGIYALVADPSGTPQWITYDIPKKDVTIDEGYLYISDGNTRIEGRGMHYELECDIPGFSCDLVFDNVVPPWKPGSGYLPYTEDEKLFQYKAVFIPWGKVSGHLTFEGQEIDVQGHGYGEKTLFVNPLGRFQPYLHAIRVFSPLETPDEERLFIGIYDAVFAKAYDFRKSSRLTVALGSEWLFTTREYKLEPVEITMPDFAPYEYPSALQLACEYDGYILEGVFRQSTFFHFTDVLESLPGIIRQFILLFMKRPVYFRYVAEFEGRLMEPDGSVIDLELSGPYEYVVAQ